MAGNSLQQPLYSTLQLSDIGDIGETDRPSTSTEILQPTTSACDDAGTGRVGKREKSVRFRSRKKLNTTVSTGEDSQLFDKWLSSEIEKNYVKIDLMKAKKELVENLKLKTKLEIQKLQSETIVFSLEP